MFRLVFQASAYAKKIAPATAMVLALSTGLAGAQPEGVIFVDDLEQQALRQASRAQHGSPQAMPYRSASPSMQSRFPQPSVQTLPGAKEKKDAQEGWSATRGFKKTLSGLFGGSSKPAAPNRPLMVQGQTARKVESSNASMTHKLAMHSSGPKPSQVTLASAEGHQQPKSRKNPLTAWMSGDKDQNVSATRSAPRTGSISESTNRKSNQPYGLVSLWSGNGSKNQAQPVANPIVKKPSANKPGPSPSELAGSGNAQDNSLASQPQEPQWANGPRWAADGTVAMITDSDQSVSSFEMPTARPVAASPAKVAMTKSRGHASTPLPKVVGPLPTAKPQPISNQSLAAKPRTGAPKHIINQHAVAAANQAKGIANRPGPLLQSQSDVVPQPNARPQSIMMPEATPATKLAEPTKTIAAMPINPVAPPSEASAKPTPKAVELLTEANRMSTTAQSEADYTAVVQLCRHVLAIDASPVAVEYSHDLASWALNRRGEVRIDQGRTKEALLDFEDALRLDPERYRAIHNRGVLAAQAGRYADAFDDFNHTIELNPKFAKAFSNRAALWVQAGEHEKASVDYRQAIDLDPDLAVAHKGRGHVCHVLGQFDLALQHLDAAARLSPEDARIVNARGDLLSDVGRYRSAKADYQRAIELDSSLSEAYRNLAWLHATCPDRQCRDTTLAMSLAQRAMELCDEPGDLEYDTLAAAHAAKGDFESAKSAMDQCLAAASDKEKPNYRWRKQLYEKGQPYVTEPASTIQQASYAE